MPNLSQIYSWSLPATTYLHFLPSRWMNEMSKYILYLMMDALVLENTRMFYLKQCELISFWSHKVIMNILHLSIWTDWLFTLRKCNCYSKICASIILPIRNGLWGILNWIIDQNDTPQIQLKQALTYFLNPNTSIVYVPLHSRSSFPSINVVLIILFWKEDSKQIIDFL